MASTDYAEMMEGLEKALKPYRERFPTFAEIPEEGRGRHEVQREMEKLRRVEASRWKEGFVSGAVYHGDKEHIDFLNRVYAINSQSNPLHTDLWPSTTKFEAEVVSMTARMLGAVAGGDAPEICGTLTSGGTESILLAMKTYRDHARAEKGITEPELIAPISAHAAFDKAAQYFGIKILRTPLGGDYAADVEAVRKALTKNTIVIVGSAPSFPHGVVDPIEALSDLARGAGVGFHTDGCLGGFLLPWAEKLGYPVPPFDFRLPGVTSISADTHKFGYAPKGSSVILYRGPELRRHQYYATTDWPGGLYFSPTFAGSRPGALGAAAWAAMVSIGKCGYREAAKRILETTLRMRSAVAEIGELRLIGESLFVVAFGSETLNIYAVLDYMAKKNWNLNGLQLPPAVHLCVTLRHTQPGVADRFAADLKEAVEHVKRNPEEVGMMGVIYGLAASVPIPGMVADVLKTYMDMMYKV